MKFRSGALAFACGTLFALGASAQETFKLGIVSFLTDLSSETIFAVLPIYFISVVGGTALVLGIMEGLADFAASSLDLASGYVSDRTGKRKWIAFSGYALSTIAKTLLVVVTSAAGVVHMRPPSRSRLPVTAASAYASQDASVPCSWWHVPTRT